MAHNFELANALVGEINATLSPLQILNDPGTLGRRTLGDGLQLVLRKHRNCFLVAFWQMSTGIALPAAAYTFAHPDGEARALYRAQKQLLRYALSFEGDHETADRMETIPAWGRIDLKKAS